MLDIQHTNPKLTPAWADHVTWGDIVSFRFPVLRRAEEPAPCKRRPCLVLDRVEGPEGVKLLLCYGTSVGDARRTGYDIDITRDEALRAGLRKTTRFIGARRILVSVRNGGFACHPDLGSPVIGMLEGAAFERMNRVRARIFAEADIAEEARRQSRVPYRRATLCVELGRPRPRLVQR